MSDNPNPCRFCDYDREYSPTILEVSLDAGVLGRIEAGCNIYLIPPQIARKKAGLRQKCRYGCGTRQQRERRGKA